MAFLALFVFFILPKYLLTTDRLIIAVAKDNSDVAVVVFDPTTPRMTIVNIPKDTEVEASRQLGTWKLGSIWHLGEQEGYSGVLLSETITRSFNFPVDKWAQEQALGFVKADTIGIVRALLFFYKSNLTSLDKIKLATFAFKTKSSGRVEINLEETGYIKKIKLADSNLGYKVGSTMPPKLAAIFADTQISKEKKLVTILNESSNKQTAQKVGEIIETLGVKVFSIKNLDESNKDCEVIGNKSKTAKKLAVIFSCKSTKDSLENDSEIKLILGKEFMDRF